MSAGDIVPLADAGDEARYGGKAVQLGAALRAGLPVPPGIALDWAFVDRVAGGDADARDACVNAFRDNPDGCAVAVRSSAVGEDSAAASFAGQHLTRLGVRSEESFVDAIEAVWQSGRAPAALAYRRKLGIAGDPRVGIVVQSMIDAECAGVMFTTDPINGADVRVIEAAWGLGESVVAGLVDPDRYRMRRDGSVAEAVAGDKEIAIRMMAGGDTAECPVDDDRRLTPCLDAERLQALNDLASACERAYPDGAAHDIEWAFDGGGAIYLLQRRAITR